MIAIINYGVGNLGSIQNMLKRVGCTGNIITNDREQILNADKIILPGVGAFDAGMEKIHESGLMEPLQHFALQFKKTGAGYMPWNATAHQRK